MIRKLHIRPLLVVVILLAAGDCQRQSKLTPRFLNQNVKQDIGQATLVVMGSVESIKDTSSRPGAAGIRPVEVEVRVHRVLKGSTTSGKICFLYMVPYGQYDGPRFEWVSRGMTGVFSLISNKHCFRAVNDFRAVIPTYNVPSDSSESMTSLIARASLPVNNGCPVGPYEVGADIRAITIPLIGSRRTRQLLETSLNSPGGSIRACACVVMALVFWLHEKCLSSLPPSEAGRLDVSQIRLNGLQAERDRNERFDRSPLSWLVMTVRSLGLDATLVQLRSQLFRPGMRIDQATCQVLQRSFQSGDLRTALAEGLARSSESAENAAMRDFSVWLDLGCPARYEGL